MRQRSYKIGAYNMSLVHPLSFMGQERNNKVPTLRSLAAENVAKQLHYDYDDTVKARFQNINQTAGGLNGAFQIARAEAIARQAANQKQNGVNDRFISGYQNRLFSPPEHGAAKDEEGLTAQMRGKKRLMGPYLSGMYFSKLQRRANRASQPWSALPQTPTPEEVDAAFAKKRGYRPGAEFFNFLAEYIGMEPGAGEWWLDTSDAMHGIANFLKIPTDTAKTLISSAWLKFTSV